MDREQIVSQTDRPRCVVEGKRLGGEHRGRCTLIVIRNPDGTYSVHPHGAGQLELLLDTDAARLVGHFLTGPDAA